MKKHSSIYLLIAFVAILFSSCEQELSTFSYPDSGLNFYYEQQADTMLTYSFVYSSAETTQDTVWVEVETMGYLSDLDRSFEFEQIAGNYTPVAVSGVHYISFDDEAVKKYYVVPAGQSKVTVPVILLRDASLQAEEVYLTVKIKANENFIVAQSNRSQTVIKFTDMLSAPTRWAIYAEAYFGVYGPVKHQFLIDTTGEKWDDEFFENTLGFTSSWSYSDGYNSNYDSGYCNYYAQYLAEQLEAYNQQRLADGLDVLTEADGTVVSIP